MKKSFINSKISFIKMYKINIIWSHFCSAKCNQYIESKLNICFETQQTLY